MNRIELPSLRADNVLGFLAGVGTLRLLVDELAQPNALLCWPEGPYSGAVVECGLSSLDELVASIFEIVTAMIERDQLLPDVDHFPPRGNGESSDPTSRLTAADGRGLALGARSDGALAQWVQAIVGLVPPIDRKTGVAGTLQKNRFLRAGPGTVWVPRTIAGVIQHTDRRTIREAFSGWRRVDGFLGAYLDPRADVDKATAQGKKAPPKRGVPGATFLAVMALPVFPVRSPSRFLAETVGWRSTSASPKGFQWPIWSTGQPLSSVRALVDHLAVAQESFAHRDRRLEALGVDAVFRSLRVSAGNNDAAMSPAALMWERTR